jgi:tryptophan-rich sensory protein
VNLFSPAARRATLLCLAAAIAALFIAQLPNDTRSDWFRGLIRPDVLPRSLERKIGFIWTTIFLLSGFATASALAADRPRGWKLSIVILTLLTLVLNMTYTYVFTKLHDLGTATIIAGLLAAVIGCLMLVAGWKRSWPTVLCQLPHFAWVCFATFVTQQMDVLNRG